MSDFDKIVEIGGETEDNPVQAKDVPFLGNVAKFIRPAEPTPEEIKNGWDEESLAIYNAEREAAAFDRIYNKPKTKPSRANRGGSPLKRWRQ